MWPLCCDPDVCSNAASTHWYLLFMLLFAVRMAFWRILNIKLLSLSVYTCEHAACAPASAAGFVLWLRDVCWSMWWELLLWGHSAREEKRRAELAHQERLDAWLHYPRSSLLTAPLPHLTRASLPSSPSLFIFSLSSMSPGQTVLLLSWCLAAPAPNTLTSTTCSRIHLQFMLL